jgi:hypothetical protein
MHLDRASAPLTLSMFGPDQSHAATISTTRTSCRPPPLPLSISFFFSENLRALTAPVFPCSSPASCGRRVQRLRSPLLQVSRRPYRRSRPRLPACAVREEPPRLCIVPVPPPPPFRRPSETRRPPPSATPSGRRLRLYASWTPSQPPILPRRPHTRLRRFRTPHGELCSDPVEIKPVISVQTR